VDGAARRSLSRSPDGAGASCRAQIETFSWKGNFVKRVLGQLRWCLNHAEHPEGAEMDFPMHLQVVAELCAKAIVAELVHCRTSEYMVRSQVPWQRYGFERRALASSVALARARPAAPLPMTHFHREEMGRHSGDDRYAPLADAEEAARPAPASLRNA
jgi:hypothetical protein